MSARLTATDAVLSCAAAQTREELHLARLALIDTGRAVLTDLDRGSLVSGTGDAGRYLLGGSGHPSDTTARRSSRLQVRLLARLARPDAEVTL
jgi:hypothetical protein